MPNNWFQFKQFLIRQERTAMKVGTDGVLLGAWSSIPLNSRNALDIGAGTGLLSLMIAQRHPHINVDAVEIDSMAAGQAEENFRNSAWRERLNIYPVSLQTFVKGIYMKYDLIICNPPFFSEAVNFSSQGRDLARHDSRLNIHEIFSYSSSIISDHGRLNLILPGEKEDESLGIAEKNLFYCRRITRVKPVPTREAKRVLLDFSKEDGAFSEDELIIEQSGRHQYSPKYRQLTSDFYL